jgi:outer membrane receptor protein involved in Fe transport
MSPYSAYDFSGDYTYIGNPDLKLTQITNYDLRWEWFITPGEILAVSGFYKQMKNPLEQNATGNIDFPSLSYVNVDQAKLWGMEFEIRKSLGIVHPYLNPFHFGFNLTLVQSEVDIPQPKYVQMRLADPDGVYFTETTRPLQGQSPYIINVDLGYDNQASGSNVNVFYNVYGKRLAYIVLTATPDAFENPLHTLDVTVMQRLWLGFNLKLGAKNLLASPVKFTHEYKGVEYIRREYKTARIFSVSVEYNL